MIQESDILGYVKLCQQAEKNESPKEKIEAYKKVKELMYTDQEKVLTKNSVSPLWIKEWLQAVQSIHELIDWRFDIDFKIWRDDRFEDITKIEEIPEWIDCMSVGETTRRFLHEDIGPDSKYQEKLSTQKGFQWLNHFFSPELNDKKPVVTPLDVVFYEMLMMIDSRFSNNARLAVVAREAEREEEAKPPMEYYGGNFFRHIAGEFELMDEGLSEEAIAFIQKHNPKNEKVEETIKDATPKKKTTLPNLEKKIKEYLKRADGIEKKSIDEESKLFAWEQLLNYIDDENGAYADEVEESLKRAEDTIFSDFLERWKLDADKEEWEVGETVRCFLNAARKAINTQTSVAGFGGIDDITLGFEWHPIVGLYSAQPMLYALIKAIRKDIDYLRIQVNILTGKDMSKQETQPQSHLNQKVSKNFPVAKKGNKQAINHLLIEEKKAKILYKALSADDVDWLVDKEQYDETSFADRLTSIPTGERIILHQLCQIYYVTKKVLFHDKARVAPEEWALIRQLFNAEDGTMDRVNTAYKKHVKNQENFDKHMGIAGRIAKS